MSISYGIPAGMEDDDEFDDVLEDDFINSVQKTCQNMKITVLPDITVRADLDGKNFDAKLPADIENWFESYKQKWTIYKNTPTMIETLSTLYASTKNPLLIALKLFANCPDSINVKNKSLPCTIMERIAAFKASHPEIASHCTDSMRMVAFNFVKEQQLPSLFKFATNAYDLNKSNYLFEDKIRELLMIHYYKDASIWITLLGLTHKFGVADVVLPLILQDKVSVAEDYLDAAPHLQTITIQLLDSLLNKEDSVYNNCGFYIGKYNYNDVKKEKLHSKPMTKLITRLAHKYKIPSDATPNMNRAKHFGYLQYLVHKKYSEKSLGTDSWRELVKDTIRTEYHDMCSEFLYSITLYNDYEEAVYWVEHFKLSLDSLPAQLQDYMTSEAIRNQGGSLRSLDAVKSFHDNMERTEPKWTERNNYHKLNLNNVDLVLVDNATLFNEMIQILRVQNLIAFDSEWKPSCRGSDVISLIQIATRKTVYLIDALEPKITQTMWSQLGRDVFNNGEILKLGFSLTADVTMFQKTLPALGISLQVQSSYLDLQVVWRKVADLKGFRFPFTGNNTSSRLCALVELCLGKPLDKSNQLSNWGSRPLRKEQLMYAALDAYCLLEVYDVLSARLTDLGVDINDLTDNTLFDNILKKSKKKFPSTRPKPNIFDGDAVQNSYKATDIKFICDESVGGLANALRKYGIDTIYMSNEHERSEIINKSISEKRFLLTRRSKGSELLSQYCYKISKNLIDEQLAEVLAFYNISVAEENIFSRCVHCNSNKFLLASQHHIKCIKYGMADSFDNEPGTVSEPPNRTFILNKITSEVCASGVTSTGAPIQVDCLHNHTIDNVNQFFICDDCGQCYWDGSHFKHVKAAIFKDSIAK